MTDEILIDLSNPDVVAALNRYAQSMIEIEEEYERAKTDALTIFKRDVEASEKQPDAPKTLTVQEILDALKSVPVTTPVAPPNSWPQWPYVDPLNPPYRITCRMYPDVVMPSRTGESEK